MTVLIVGLGSVGRRHLRNLRSLGRHRLLLCRTLKSTLPDDELADLETYTDLETALAHDPDLVVISNPTSEHLGTARSAARSGCHLLIEKPVSHDLAGLDELSKLVDERGVKVLVGYQFRFHPGLIAAHRLVSEGRLGRVVWARAQYSEYLPGCHPWEDYRGGYAARADLGGGVLLTFCHPLDYLRWLLGGVRDVSAVIGQVSDLRVDVEDSADLTLRFDSGAVAAVHLDFVGRPAVHRLELIGLEGQLEWDNRDGTTRWRRSDESAWSVIAPPQDFERNTMFLDEMRHLLDCIEYDRTPDVSLADGIRIVELVDAARRSAIEERTVRLAHG